MEALFRFEDKLKKWIETERKKWYLTLFVIGLFLGFIFDYLLLGSIGIKKIMGLGLLLMLIEYLVGGSGVQ